MFLNTWIIHTSVKLTNHILDSGSTPSVITAIMKQQTTERARNILNHGMDIYSGSAICTGENNFFTNFYNSSPVGITVEGSNTLTRGLIIFGQGLNKSHPYIFPIFQSIQDNNINDFKNNFNKLLLDVIKNYVSVINPFSIFNKNFDKYQYRLDRATVKFSVLSNFIALLGGKIKSKQMISGNMADILSNLYLGYGLIWYHHHFKSNILLRNECIDLLMNELEYKMNLIIENYPIKILHPFLYPLKSTQIFPQLENKNTLVNLIFVEDISNIIEKCIFIENIKGSIIIFNKNGILKLETLINIVSKLLDYKKNIIFENSSLLVKNNIMKPDLSKFNIFFENFIFTDIEKALKITIDNFIK
jgi:acyl-CoA dehydrogenase